MSFSRRVLLVGVVVLASGCHDRQYDLVPVPHAGDGAAPVKAQVRRIAWADQPEGGELNPEAHVAVEVDLFNADGVRSFSIGALGLVAHPTSGEPPVVFVRAKRGEELTLGPSPDRGDPLVPVEVGTLAPHETRTVWATFIVPADAEPRGPLTLILSVPVKELPPLEIVLADPRPGGPRWTVPGPVRGAYHTGGASFLSGARDITVLEPFGISGRWSFGRWVLAVNETYAFIYQEALAGGPPASGLSFGSQLTWQPWRWSLAPYVEGGVFLGLQARPRAYLADGGSDFMALPRVGAGILWSAGPRLGATGVLPFQRPLSPQRRFGARFGYTRWFNVGERGGVGGVQLSLELGVSP